jgi:hypothetical protein
LSGGRSVKIPNRKDVVDDELLGLSLQLLFGKKEAPVLSTNVMVRIGAGQPNVRQAANRHKEKSLNLSQRKVREHLKFKTPRHRKVPHREKRSNESISMFFYERTQCRIHTNYVVAFLAIHEPDCRRSEEAVG